MYDSCPERSVSYEIPAQGSVRLTSVVSIRWHHVHTCQSQVLASHTQRVNVRFRNNAQRLFSDNRIVRTIHVSIGFPFSVGMEAAACQKVSRSCMFQEARR